MARELLLERIPQREGIEARISVIIEEHDAFGDDALRLSTYFARLDSMCEANIQKVVATTCVEISLAILIRPNINDPHQCKAAPDFLCPRDSLNSRSPVSTTPLKTVLTPFKSSASRKATDRA